MTTTHAAAAVAAAATGGDESRGKNGVPHALSTTCLRFAMSAVSAISPSCLKQWVASKALVDYVTTGVCVLRNALRQEIITQLHKGASAIDKWIPIFNTDQGDSKRAMAKAGHNADCVMSELFTFAKEHLFLIDKKQPMLGRGSTFLCSR
jgi:hypothetical protein